MGIEEEHCHWRGFHVGQLRMVGLSIVQHSRQLRLGWPIQPTGNDFLPPSPDWILSVECVSAIGTIRHLVVDWILGGHTCGTSSSCFGANANAYPWLDWPLVQVERLLIMIFSLCSDEQQGNS